jgi:hypothetical protein
VGLRTTSERESRVPEFVRIYSSYAGWRGGGTISKPIAVERRSGTRHHHLQRRHRPVCIARRAHLVGIGDVPSFQLLRFCVSHVSWQSSAGRRTWTLRSWGQMSARTQSLQGRVQDSSESVALLLISARGGNSRLSALFLHVAKIGSCLIYRLLALWPENQITCPVISSFPVLLFVCLSPSHFRQWSARTVEFTNSYFPARLSRPRPMIRLLS